MCLDGINVIVIDLFMLLEIACGFYGLVVADCNPLHSLSHSKCEKKNYSGCKAHEKHERLHREPVFGLPYCVNWALASL